MNLFIPLQQRKNSYFDQFKMRIIFLIKKPKGPLKSRNYMIHLYHQKHAYLKKNILGHIPNLLLKFKSSFNSPFFSVLIQISSRMKIENVQKLAIVIAKSGLTKNMSISIVHLQTKNFHSLKFVFEQPILQIMCTELFICQVQYIPSVFILSSLTIFSLKFYFNIYFQNLKHNMNILHNIMH